ncbi:pro-neuregulin-1, membrane-bound isoform isoform X10 [Zonotrichia leucophrys gambelii]|uniref:pro-neuregulin-1, membrane-bound isoform isoform X10 n=1 Tax=Zonotrichia leucophrys gambelii TaxID=257770 RepID=UPI003140C31C
MEPRPPGATAAALTGASAAPGAAGGGGDGVGAPCGGCGRATSGGPIQYSLAPTQTDVNTSSNSVPLKLKEMKNQEAAVGQKLVLRCETTSEYPALRFKWLKNGKEITKKNRPENIKIPKKQKKYSELHIYRATLADAGEYVCRVSSKLGNDSTKASVIITDTNATSTSTTGTSHLTKCDIKQKAFCVNGGECYMVKDLPNPPRYLCRCPNEFTGDRCQNYVMASFYSTSTTFLSVPQ